MKKTPFYENHLALNAKIVDFAGYEMPVYYTSINEEHLCVRNNVGVFDISHMGEFMVKGNQALPLLQYITTNDVEKLENNQAQYSMLTNNEGNILDDILVYCIEKDKTYMLVVNASNIEKDWQWVNEQNKNFGTELENISDHCALLAVQGPKATKLVQEMAGDWDILEMPYYHFKKGLFLGIKDVLISVTGYTGAGGVEIYIKDKDNNAKKIWDTLFEVGKAYGLKPIGLGARDTLRLEMGYCLYGNDIDETINPIESNLGWATKMYKKNFVGKEALEQIKHKSIGRKRIGFILQQKAIPRSHCLIKDGKNNTLGVVTSGTFSPSLQLGIGMGYVDLPHSKIGSSFFVEIRDKKIPATIVNLPFLKTHI